MEEFRKEVAAFLKENAEQMVADIQDFARIRSVSRADLGKPGAPFGPECRTMLDHALAHARNMGFKAEDHEGYCGSVYLGENDERIAIVGHLDVVPEGVNWIWPPYEATRKGDWLIGRGVSDNKSAAIMGLYLMKFFREHPGLIRHGMQVIFGCSEETGMADLHWYAQNIGEPTVTLIPDSGFPVNYAQKGSLKGYMEISLGDQLASFTGGEVFNMVPPTAVAVLRGIKATAEFFPAPDFEIEETAEGSRITAHGIASHAAHPEGGKSAIHMLAKALTDSGLLSGESYKAAKAITDMTSDYYGAHCGIAVEDPDTGKTTMVCGVAKEVAPGRTALSVDCRLSIAADQEKNVADLTAYAEANGFTCKGFTVTKPVYIPKDDPKVVALSDLYAEITGTYLPPYTSGGGTYSREFRRAITFGPGFPDRLEPDFLPENHGGAHGPDEVLYIPNLLKAFEIYACAVLKLDTLI